MEKDEGDWLGISGLIAFAGLTIGGIVTYIGDLGAALAKDQLNRVVRSG
nr:MULTISPECIES: hypothetical protein [Rhizobium]